MTCGAASGRQAAARSQAQDDRVRPFLLVSRWRLPADVGAVWDELADPAFRWPRWWPQLVAEEVRATGRRTAVRWSRVLLRVRSPLGWSLRFALVLASSRRPRGGRRPAPGTARLTVSGDLVGTADITVAPRSEGTDVSLVWSVALARGGVVGCLVRMLPRRVLVAAHAAVMRGGERGLATELARRR
jgi:hypothetical protein